MARVTADTVIIEEDSKNGATCVQGVCEMETAKYECKRLVHSRYSSLFLAKPLGLRLGVLFSITCRRKVVIS